MLMSDKYHRPWSDAEHYAWRLIRVYNIVLQLGTFSQMTSHNEKVRILNVFMFVRLSVALKLPSRFLIFLAGETIHRIRTPESRIICQKKSLDFVLFHVGHWSDFYFILWGVPEPQIRRLKLYIWSSFPQLTEPNSMVWSLISVVFWNDSNESSHHIVWCQNL